MGLIRSQADRTELLIYETIGETGITARAVSNALKASAGKPLTVRINSPGGDVFEGIAIFNLLSSHRPRPTIVIDGLAASIASVVALSGPTRRMAKAAFFMLHSPWSVVSGDSRAMREMASVLDSVDKSIIGTYVSETRLSVAQVSKMLDDETWLDSAKALEHGFATLLTIPRR